MTMKGEKVFKVKNIKNGGIYLIGEVKLKKEPMDWELVVEEEKPKEMTANEMKLELKEKGIEFKGNASREDLKKLLDES